MKKKILIMAVNPKTTQRIRLDEEVREIEGVLQRAKHRDCFDSRSKWAVRLRDLRQGLLDHEPQIVHFIGHGTKEGLIVEDESGFPVKVSAKALSELFKLCSKHVECVILGACFSASQATPIRKYIKYVIGMRKEIKDRAAIEFAVGFYDALGAGRSVEDAFEFGRVAILQNFPNLPEHLIPVLKKRKSNNTGQPEKSIQLPEKPSGKQSSKSVARIQNINVIDSEVKNQIFMNEGTINISGD